MTLAEELSAVRAAAQAFADGDEQVVGVVPAEPAQGRRIYLCAYEEPPVDPGAESADGSPRRWLAIDPAGRPVVDRGFVRDAVSIAAMCELAEESAGGGDIGELRASLVELRLTENPQGIEDAEMAAAELQETIRRAPRLASTAYLDALGLAATKLEQTLGGGGSPFAEAMQAGAAAAEELASEVERRYKATLA